MDTLNIFDGYAKIRDLTSAEDVAAIEALPDDHRTKLFECIGAVKATEAGQDRMVAARADVRRKEAATLTDGLHAEPMRNADQKTAEHAAAMRAVSAAQRAGYVPAKPVKNELKAAADNALIEARAELQRSTTELRALERKSGEAIDAWRKCLPVMTRDTLMRDHVARGIADRAARVARGESPEPSKITQNYQSELDRVRGAGRPKPARPIMR